MSSCSQRKARHTTRGSKVALLGSGSTSTKTRGSESLPSFSQLYLNVFNGPGCQWDTVPGKNSTFSMLPYPPRPSTEGTQHPSRIYARAGPSILLELLRDAEQAYRSLEVGSINIFRAQRAPWSGYEWGSSGTKRTRPLESVVLEEGVSDRLLDDVKEFLESREWYRQRGIPFRRGYLMVNHPIAARFILFTLVVL